MSALFNIRRASFLTLMAGVCLCLLLMNRTVIAQEQLISGSQTTSQYAGQVACFGKYAGVVKSTGKVNKLNSTELKKLIAQTTKALLKAKNGSAEKKLKSTLQQQKAAIKCLVSPLKSSAVPKVTLLDTLPTGALVNYSLDDNGKYKIQIQGTNFKASTSMVVSINGTTDREFHSGGTLSGAVYELPIQQALNTTLQIRALEIRKVSGRRHILRSAPFSIQLVASSDGGDVSAPPEEGGSPPTGTPTPPPVPGTPTATATPTATPPVVGQTGDHIATLQHDRPTGVTDYLIDASIPVPAGTLTEAQMKAGQSPFAIDNNGSLIPLQVTGITKYPVDAQGYSLVNVAARVNAQSAAVANYKVYLANSNGPAWPSPGTSAQQIVQNSPIAIPGSVRQLFQPGMLMAEIEDVFGNIYRCDMTQNEQGSPKLFSYGWAKLALRVACMTKPLSPGSGPTAPLSHMAFVTSYFVFTSGDEAVKISIVLGNSIAGSPLHGGNPVASAMKDLYFKRFEVKVQGAWDSKLTWETPVNQTAQRYSGFTIVPLMPTRSDGKMHLLNERRQAPFEFTLHSLSAPSVAQAQLVSGYHNLAFAIEGQSSNNPTIKLYSPHNLGTAQVGMAPGSPWPTLNHLGLTNVKQSLDAGFHTTYDYFKTGKCPLFSKTYTDSSQTHGVAACGYKVTERLCNYPYLASDNVANRWVNWIPDPANPSQCIPDPNAPPASAVATTAPFPLPWGVKYGGMTGGSEINLGGRGFDVWAARSRKGMLNIFLHSIARGISRNEKLQMLDGEPLSPLDAIRTASQGQYVPVRAFGGYDPTYCGVCDSLFGFNSAPMQHINYVLANNLQPDYNPGTWADEDEQHFVRMTAPMIAVVQLMFHPMIVDAMISAGNYAYFANPNLPSYFNSSGQAVYFSGALANTRPAQAGVGNYSVGRAFAHTQIARVMTYALSNSAYRSFMLPYHQFVAREAMFRSQMYNGLINKSGLTSKNSPLGACETSVTRENSFIQVANAATLKRVLLGVSNEHALELQATIIAMTASRLLSPMVVRPGNSGAYYANVMVAKSPNVNTIFTDWTQIPGNDAPNPTLCKADALGSGNVSGGEDHMMVSIGDEFYHDPLIWQSFKRNLPSTSATTLGKLQGLSLYNLSSHNNVMNLGWCQAKEAAIPGYCQ